MNTNQSTNVIQKKKWKKKIVILLVTVSMFLSWVGLTKAGHISNFLNLDILCVDGPGIILQGACLIQGMHPHRSCGILSDNNGELYSTCGEWSCVSKNYVDVAKKPVIYLYPQEKQDVRVQLDYQGEIFADYPKYDKKINGWEVVAYPDGKIVDHRDNKEYSYLFWEGIPDQKIDWDFSKGYVVAGGEVRQFLQNKLSQLGLTPKEYNEFIVYWYPLMQDNKYNLIHFAEKQYTDTATLTITPKPDSVLRVFMVYKSLEEKVKIEEQKLKPFERKGFTVVEWGGANVK